VQVHIALLLQKPVVPSELPPQSIGHGVKPLTTGKGGVDCLSESAVPFGIARVKMGTGLAGMGGECGFKGGDAPAQVLPFLLPRRGKSAFLLQVPASAGGMPLQIIEPELRLGAVGKVKGTVE
jgi:hypothetical protein